MPVLNITQDDINRQKQCTKGMHMFELKAIVSKPAKDKLSINHTFEFECIDDPSIEGGINKGRYAFNLVSEKAIGMGLIPMISAFTGTPIDQVEPTSVDTDKLIGNKCWAEIVDELYEGKVQKRMLNFTNINAKPAF